MNHFYKERLKEIAEQTRKLDLCAVFLSGVTDGMAGRNADPTGNRIAIAQMQEIYQAIKEAIREILLFEWGAAYYDYMHSNQTEAATTTDILKQLTGGGGNDRRKRRI